MAIVYQRTLPVANNTDKMDEATPATSRLRTHRRLCRLFCRLFLFSVLCAVTDARQLRKSLRTSHSQNEQTTIFHPSSSKLEDPFAYPEQSLHSYAAIKDKSSNHRSLRRELDPVAAAKETDTEDEDADSGSIGSTIVSDPQTIGSATTFNEDWLLDAVQDDEALTWQLMPSSEQPDFDTYQDYVGEFAWMRVPVLYEGEAARYGISEASPIASSFFSIYVRRFRHRLLDMEQSDSEHAIKHVLLINGGPGYSNAIWGENLRALVKQYGRDSRIVFYAADHRGIHRSRGIFLKDTHSNKTSWLLFRKGTESTHESTWRDRPQDFEAKTGYPLVAMSCSSAARDWAILARLLERSYSTHNAKRSHRKSRHRTSAHPHRHKHLFYLHSESYGSQVAMRMLTLLPGDFFAAAIIDGWATMELASESARTDFGILRSCEEDPLCRKLLLRPPKLSDHVLRQHDLIQMRSVYDLKNIFASLDASPHNQACRSIFHTELGSIYGPSASFWHTAHMVAYDLLADDFVNEYNPKSTSYGNFYSGMLVLPLIKQLYYCDDRDKLRAQVAVIRTVLDRRYRQESLLKGRLHVESESGSSYFVQSYVNIHEAFDLYAAATVERERAFCQQPARPFLVNQCDLVREMATARKALHNVRGSPGKLEVAMDKFLAQARKRHKGKRLSRGRKNSEIDGKGKRQSRRVCRAYTYKLDALAFVLPRLTDTKIFVIAGSLDVKTPATASRRYFDNICTGKTWIGPFNSPYSNSSNSNDSASASASSIADTSPRAIPDTGSSASIVTHNGHYFFELENVAHWAQPCSNFIVQAALAHHADARSDLLKRARRCVEDLRQNRLLDWQFENVKGFDTSIWW